MLTKSPIRPTRNNGSMFSMNLCGRDPSSTIRAICFSEGMFSKFQPNTTYNLNQFKVKKAFGKSSSNVELLVDNDTNVSTSTSQFALEEHSFTISQILNNETENVRFINLKAKVMKVDNLIVVGTYPDNKAKRNIHLADHSGHIQMVLWRDRAENSQVVEGNVLSIKNAVVSNYHQALSLTTTFETTINTIDEVMTAAPAEEPSLNSNLVSLETTILAIKEFSCQYSCIGCRKGIDLDPSEDSVTVTCPTCSSVFLKQIAVITNRCMILLSNKQWFSTHTEVSFFLEQIL